MEPLFSIFFDDFKICVAPENKGDIRASNAVPQVVLNSRGSLDVGWDMTDHRKRGALSGLLNLVFVSYGTAVHLGRHERYVTFFVVHQFVVAVVVSHIQRIGCQPEKTTLHGGQSRSWSAEQGKENIVQLDGVP